MKNRLCTLELYLYFFMWTSATLFSLFMLYKAQEDILKKQDIYLINDLQPGWSFVARLRDVTDVEWSSWKYFIQTSWYYLIIQFTIAEIIRNVFKPVLKYWYIMSSILFIVFNMGLKQVMIILAQPTVYAVILYFGGKKLSIWIVSILLLLSYNSLKYIYFFWTIFDHDDIQDEEVYLILSSIAWIELRCISYSIDFTERKCQHSMNWADIVNMFTYVLYLPLLYTGPVILYEEFEKSFIAKQETLTRRVIQFIWDMIFFLLYTFILDLLFHYIYFFAMQSNMKLIRKLPTFALCGGGLWMGLEFHMKYVISYGTAAAFARMDNMEPPPLPRCIARIHVYSQMWRHFDVGLYKFLVKYIYKPCYSTIDELSSLPTTANKLLASSSTFIFIFMWHGTVWHIFVWSVLNYSGITLEHFGKVASKHEKYIYFKKNYLRTQAMEARFVAILCSPLLALSAISNFYLFAGSEVGNLFFECFSQPTIFNFLTLFISLYCCCHVSMALEHVPSRGTIRKTSLENL